ncbi:translationally-controlled tumor protein-like [Echinops telfairi]|uniref:Translationally-controlled tumor protein-like n=1 Tax=Echinops telfairi TaxID=9371 RepID=A0AC55CYM4_ECHTE|nr:translationally-controlled tumor protein-like [Echinops telfairi]
MMRGSPTSTKSRRPQTGCVCKWRGEKGSRVEGNIGGNASAEGPKGDGTASTVIAGVNIVMNPHLQETSLTEEAYKGDIKDYMKSSKGKLAEQKPERGKPFLARAAAQIKHILVDFKNDQLFLGENMNPDGMLALLDCQEDAMTPHTIFLELEKC